MELALAIQTGLLFGAALSVLLSFVLIGIGLLNPEIMLNDYPPDIRARHGTISERAKRQKRLLTLPLMLLMLVAIVIPIAQLAQMKGSDPTFVEILVMVFIMFMVFNLVDLVIIDWLIFVMIQPKLFVLPGTAGMAGYRDYGFHFRGFLIGTAISAIASLVIAGIAALLFAIV